VRDGLGKKKKILSFERLLFNLQRNWENEVRGGPRRKGLTVMSTRAEMERGGEREIRGNF